MKGKEKKYTREPNYMSRHPCLQFRMRTILLDWIIEVGEATPSLYYVFVNSSLAILLFFEF